jgi:hypothetical protein
MCKQNISKRAKRIEEGKGRSKKDNRTKAERIEQARGTQEKNT